jgi:hypothetical protein
MIRQSIELIGVVDDGSLFVDSVRRNLASSIDAPLGGTITIRVRLVYPSGVAVDLSADPAATSRLAIASCIDLDRTRPTVSKPGTLQPDGSILFTITTTDQRLLTPGRWIYDCWVTFRGARYQVVPISTVTFHATTSAAC